MTVRFLLAACLTTTAFFAAGCYTSIGTTENPAAAHEFSVSNVYYTMKDSDAVVHYDLSGPADEPYNVRLVLRRETQPFFKLQPIDITGDVGTEEHPGRNKEIVWQLYKDVPYGLDGDDYYFEVSVTRLGLKEGGASWLYYVGGAVVAGAAAVYFGTDLSNKGGGNPIPPPPPRPQ